MIIEPIQNSLSINRMSNGVEGLNDLDEQFIRAMADKMSVMQQAKLDITQMIDRSGSVTDPAMLIKMQAQLADYSLNVEFVSRFAQRIIGSIDSLVKS
ncbi:MAG: type III secretion system inner rod subunit SctI [Enterovibrio sp.]